MARRENFDFYPTPSWATDILMRHIDVSPSDRVIEPCAGDGDIADALEAHGKTVVRSDIREGLGLCGDATDADHWSKLGKVDWTITNPPFSLADKIVDHALKRSSVGVAMLLRLTFLEPCKGRIGILTSRPPVQLIVTPRISFTGDGKTDNVTTAWLVWHDQRVDNPIVIEPKPTEQAGQLFANA